MVRLSTLLALATSVAAAPTSVTAASTSVAAAPKPNFCSVWKGHITVLARQPSATPFCSSFLHLKTSTVTITSASTLPKAVQSTVVTVTAPTNVVTVTNTVTSPTTITASGTGSTGTSTITEFATVTSSSDLSCFSQATTLSGNFAAPNSIYYESYSAGYFAVRAVTTQTPIPTPEAVDGEPSATISKLCSCLSIAQPTTTKTVISKVTKTTLTRTTNVTPSSTTTVQVTAYSTYTTSVAGANSAISAVATQTVTVTQANPAGSSGLAYYSYTNNYDFYAINPPYDVSTFQDSNAESQGFTHDAMNVVYTYYDSNSGSNLCNLPDGTGPQPCDQLTLVMKGFLFAAQSGIYQIGTDDNVDNFLGLWSGDNALSGYTNDNADFIGIRAGYGPYHGGSMSYNLTAGQLLPITLIYLNGGGAGGYFAWLTTPDGQQHTGDLTQFFYPPCNS